MSGKGVEMKVHYLDCGVLYPLAATSFMQYLAKCTCLCMLLEVGEQLVLVDTGMSVKDIKDIEGIRRLGHTNIILDSFFDNIIRSAQKTMNPDQTAIRQVESLGFRAEDVMHIICTHLDFDHAGGLCDFPHAQVHVLHTEYEAALKPRGFRERERYRQHYFTHGPNWRTYKETSKEPWFGMDCIRELDGLPPEIILVPLYGHTRGHCGVAVQTEEGWILHCGDAYYVRRELEEGKKVPFGITCTRLMVDHDFAGVRRQRERLKELARKSGGELTMYAAHVNDQHVPLSTSI